MSRPASWYGEMWREALPLGNGKTGVLIPGAIAFEEIHFNRYDLWKGGDPGGDIPDVTDAFAEMRRAIDSGDYVSANQDNIHLALEKAGYSAKCESPYPLGWLTVEQEHDSMFRDYRRGIDMRSGVSFVEYSVGGCGFKREMFVSRDSDIAVLRMSADKPFCARYGFRLFSETSESITTERKITRSSKDGITAAEVAFLGDFTSSVNGDTLEIAGQNYTVLVKCGSHGSPTALDAYLGESFESLLEKHTALHTTLYDAVSITLAKDEDHRYSNEQMLEEAYQTVASAALLERLWRFGRYLFLSATAEDSYPVPLYGLWHGGENLQWSQYVANENVEMTYWHALAGGFSYAIIPLIRYYTEKTEIFRKCAANIFGMRGIWISAYTSPSCAGASVTAAVIINWISCAGWLCRHFWEYYSYTGDKKLLCEEILPFMHEAALFYLDYAVDDGGKIRLYPSVSPENSPENLCSLPTKTRTGHPCPAVQNALMDFAVMKELLTNLLCGIKITGLYADEADTFRNLLSKIPEYSQNSDGAVKEWLHTDLDDNYHHRHLSHLYPVFPGNEVNAQNDPELFEAFRRAVHLRKLGSQSGWSLTHMANIYARFGEAESAAECLDIMAKSVICNSLMTVHNDWRNMGMTVNWEKAPIQLDAAFGAVNAVQEMLFCAKEDSMSVLNALPERLKSGSVCGIRFPCGRVDIAWDEHTVNLTVTAEKPVDTVLSVCQKDRGRLTLSVGERVSLTYER